MDTKILWQLSYGLYALLADDHGKPSGCIVNTVFQITSTDPIIAVSVNKNNYTNQLIKDSGFFGVSIISQDTSKDAIAKLGFASGRDTDKLDGLKHHIAEHNIPILDEACTGHLLCQVVSVTETSTHDVFLGKVIDTQAGVKAEPMTYKYYHDVVKGAAPKNAPTYRAPEAQAEQSYVCEICSHVYHGDISKESDDYRCPVCGVDKSHFKPVEQAPVRYICDICSYVYEGDITKEPDSYRCPICKADKSHFKKL